MPELDDALLSRLLIEQARSIDTSAVTLHTHPAPRPHHRRATIAAAPVAVAAVLLIGATLAENRLPHRTSDKPTGAGTSNPSPRPASPTTSKPAAKADLGVFAPACGHPGTTVTVPKTPVTVRRSECDLTGVIVRLSNGYGSVVPAQGTSEGDVDAGIGATPASGGINVSVDPTTGDVTISAEK